MTFDQLEPSAVGAQWIAITAQPRGRSNVSSVGMPKSTQNGPPHTLPISEITRGNPPNAALGVLGVPGFTAYAGMKVIG
jgi:NADPH-dependent curcumin reductase CurA